MVLKMRGNAKAERTHLLGAVDALNTRRHDASLRDGKSRNDKDCDKGLVHDETSHDRHTARRLYFSSGDQATAVGAAEARCPAWLRWNGCHYMLHASRHLVSDSFLGEK